jgi:hypothetical protein
MNLFAKFWLSIQFDILQAINEIEDITKRQAIKRNMQSITAIISKR